MVDLKKFMEENYEEQICDYDKSNLCITTKDEVFKDLEKNALKEQDGVRWIDYRQFLIIKKKHTGK